MSEIVTDYFPGQAAADGFTMRASAMTDPLTDQEDSVGIQTSIGGEEQRRICWDVGGKRHFEFMTMPLTGVPGCPACMSKSSVAFHIGGR